MPKFKKGDTSYNAYITHDGEIYVGVGFIDGVVQQDCYVQKTYAHTPSVNNYDENNHSSRGDALNALLDDIDKEISDAKEGLEGVQHNRNKVLAAIKKEQAR